MNAIINRLQKPELFIGFVAPIGSDIAPALRGFSECFRSFGYEVQEIKVTDVFDELKEYISPIPELKHELSFERYDTHIRYGNLIREKFKDQSALALTTINKIRERRRFCENKSGSDVVYLLHQFKRKEEIDLMRSVYGRLFLQVSVYSRRGARVDYLSRKFASSNNGSHSVLFRDVAERIIQIDENQVDNSYGQRVSKIFHDADFIINSDIGEDSVLSQIERFVNLLFSSNKISPTKMEYGMYAAKAAALRTLDLSRQVGAAIFRSSGEIISMGSNEVPKAHGGTYWCEDEHDDRDFRRGVDSNEKRKREILREILSLVLPDKKEVEKALLDKSIRESQLMDALEYGRIVHAEMVALTDAARLGLSVKGAHLYSTTFPCHLCAKHIIASGIQNVIFLEPYPKSLASDLHSDALKVEGADRGQHEDSPCIRFDHFYGITPRRYRELFERGKRKDDDGKFVSFGAGKAQLLFEVNEPFYLSTEENVVEALSKKADAVVGKSVKFLKP